MIKQTFTNIALLFSLILFSSAIAHCQRITGNRQVVEKTRQPGSFTAIEVEDGIDLYLQQGDTEELVLRADENIHEYIITEVEGAVLKIYADASFRRVKEKEMLVTFRDLRELRARQGSDVKSRRPLELETLSAELSSGSDLNLEVSAQEMEFELSSGSDAEFSGEVTDLRIRASGGSDIDGRDLEVTGECVLRLSGGSDAEVYVTGKLDIEASGASDVEFRGDPEITNLKTSGGSDVRGN